MAEQDSPHTSASNEQQRGRSDQLDIVDTAIIEYLDIVKSEYEIERNKKQSFENRAGLILALLGAICIFVFEKVQLKDVLALMTIRLTFVDFVKIVSGITVYMGFLFTTVKIVQTISVQQHNNFEVKNIDEPLLIEQRLPALCRLTFTYRDIIVQHRALNEKRATAFRRSLYGISATLVAIIVYITLV